MTWSHHQALGIDHFRSVIGLTILVIVLVAVIVHWILTTAIFIDTTATQVAGGVDVFVGMLILLVALTGPLAIGYAALNGGPLLALLIAILPYTLATVLRGMNHLTTDFTLVFGCGAVALWIALWKIQPTRLTLTILGTIFSATTISVITIASLARGWEQSGLLALSANSVVGLLLLFGGLIALVELISMYRQLEH